MNNFKNFGVMFHHFHDGKKHNKSQGSIDANSFEALLSWLESEGYTVLPALEWQRKIIRGELNEGDICITFDDALSCQYDIALPVMNRRGITAFWFVYSSALMGMSEDLELFRHYRNTSFNSIDEFYDKFELTCYEMGFKHEITAKIDSININEYLLGFDFYTIEDRRFRYIRDRVLGPDRYKNVMGMMLKNDGVELLTLQNQLWLSELQVKKLHDDGHVIGLHSFSHPTSIAEFDHFDQSVEYVKNFEHIQRLTGSAPLAMSHPCNSYSEATLSVLSDLDIRIGFRSNMHKVTDSLLEIPRVDHAELMGKIL
jgi:peptidoglycan/xylan/chitin deacetylase (PgdA/CDA1 family)